MLNIEVIKFEAQDVITASAVKCVCSDETWYHGAGYGSHDESGALTKVTTEDHTRGDVKCYADEHPNCPKAQSQIM